MPQQFHLAQINVARLLAPIDDPKIADFVDQLDSINALAETSPGFVWRLKSESGNATDISLVDDPSIIVNMSVWESVESLHHYVFETDHLKVFKRKREWFHSFGRAHLALWWIAPGSLPGVDEAQRRLELIDQLGPTPEAFTLARPFAPPFSLSAISAGPLSPTPASSSDAADVIALLSQCELPVDDIDASGFMNRLGAWTLCVRDTDGKLVAVAAVEPCGDAALLRSVAVLPEHRRGGLARTLVETLQALARERGFNALYLLTETAAGVFESLGYRRIERNAVPERVARTPQFSAICPDSAICMTYSLMS